MAGKRCNCGVCQQSRKLDAIIISYKLSKDAGQFLRDLWEQMASAETDLSMARMPHQRSIETLATEEPKNHQTQKEGHMIVLGSKVRDKVTGYTGIAVARTEWLNGCVRISVQGKAAKGKLPDDTHWVDIEQVEVISKPAMKKAKPSGGPMPDPKVQRGPRF